MYRILPAETATEAGKYNWRRAPYQREWLDVMTDDKHQKVVLMTGARVGKTTCLENALGFYMHQDPAAIMVMLPTLGEAEKFSVNNIDPLIRDTRVLRELVKDKRTRDSGNMKLLKRYRGGHLSFVGAESATQLHGKTIRVLLADECDRFPFSAGKDGDPLTLAMVRTTTFGHRRKIVLCSTPTYKDLSHIEREFLASDQRYYHVPCPHCNHFQKLVWKNINYSDDAKNPVYVCEECACAIEEKYKYRMLLNGRWVAENPTSRTAGFHLSSLYSVYMTWAELVEEWLAAKNNRFRLQVFINSRLGETWDETGERVTSNQLVARLEAYTSEVPTGVGLLSCGVDIQGNRVEAAVWGVGVSDEIWLVDTVILDGDTGKDEVWRKLQDFLFTARYKTATGATLGIRTIAIDRGYNTERVDRFVQQIRRHDTANRVIIATRGVENYPRLVADRPKQSKTTNSLYFQVGTNIAKDHIAKLLSNTVPGPNYIHLPVSLPSNDGHKRWLDNEVLKQLTSEKPVLTYVKGKPKREWRKVYERNEQWDMLILAYAATLHLGQPLLTALPKLVEKVSELQPVTSTPTEPVDEPKITALQRSGLRIHNPLYGAGRNIW
jgi:phage terminase large subunit GpA-like protein